MAPFLCSMRMPRRSRSSCMAIESGRFLVGRATAYTGWNPIQGASVIPASQFPTWAVTNTQPRFSATTLRASSVQ